MRPSYIVRFRVWYVIKIVESSAIKYEEETFFICEGPKFLLKDQKKKQGGARFISNW